MCVCVCVCLYTYIREINEAYIDIGYNNMEHNGNLNLFFLLTGNLKLSPSNRIEENNQNICDKRIKKIQDKNICYFVVVTRLCSSTNQCSIFAIYMLIYT